MLEVGDRVVFFDTGDYYLDGQQGIVRGFYQEHFVVVAFDKPPNGYGQHTVVSRQCLELCKTRVYEQNNNKEVR